MTAKLTSICIETTRKVFPTVIFCRSQGEVHTQRLYRLDDKRWQTLNAHHLRFMLGHKPGWFAVLISL